MQAHDGLRHAAVDGLAARALVVSDVEHVALGGGPRGGMEADALGGDVAERLDGVQQVGDGAGRKSVVEGKSEGRGRRLSVTPSDVRRTTRPVEQLEKTQGEAGQNV